MKSTIREVIALANHFEIECLDKHGNLKWKDTIDNLVVGQGLDDVLDKYLKGAAYTAAHFIGLTDGTPTPAASDTMASHPGWVEVVAYAEATRPDATWGTVATQSVNNSANRATFTINADGTVVGGCMVSTSNTKGGTSDILYGVGAFNAGDKPLDASDVLNVTVTANASAS